MESILREGWGLERQEGMVDSWDHKGHACSY